MTAFTTRFKFMNALPKVLLLLLMACVNTVFAQYANVPVTGYNADIVADGAVGIGSNSTTADVDGSAWVFASTTFNPGSGVCVTGGTALPASNQITSTNTTTNTGITYTLQSYGAGTATNNNALRLAGGTNGTLTVTTPVAAASLYFVCLGGSGTANFTAVVNFSDATSETITAGLSAPDWCGGAATYKLTTQQYYRISRTATTCSGTNCQYLYEIPAAISGANYGRTITSIVISNASGGGILNIMAVGMKAPCAVPPAPTALTFGTTGTSAISGSFTASSATGYVVVRYPAGSPVTAPVNGTTYSAGMSVGVGTVVSAGTTTAFSATALSASTAYDFYVYGYNTGANCGGPVYSATALNGSSSTTACSAPTIGTVSGGIRTITVGAAGFDATSLTAVLSNISANGINTPTVIELQSNYSSAGETFPIVLPYSPCTGPVNTLLIRPAAGANGLQITGANAGPTIDFNGASYVTIDGRPGGTGSGITFTAAGSFHATNLNIVNTNAGGVAVKLDNGANNNAIKYCDLQGQNTTNANSLPGGMAGVVYFENTGANGNDNNAIDYCNVHSNSASAFPAVGIFSLGTNVTTGYALSSNDNNVVSNSNIYDYFNASASGSSVGLLLNYGNNGWSISGNSFFQTASRALNGSFSRAIWLIPYRAAGNVGNAFTVVNNFIGGSQPLCAGSPYTMTSSGYFGGIRMEVADGVTPAASLVQGNIIRNISLTTSSTNDGVQAIVVTGGSGLATINNNMIGTATGTGGATTNGITIAGSGSSVAAHMIMLGGTLNLTVQNNTIANILIPNANNYFSGIFSNSGVTANISNNTVGSLTDPQSIYFSDASTSTQTGRYIQGLRIVPGSTASYTITGNTVAGIWSNNTYTGASGQVVGIFISASTSNLSGGVNNNVVRNLYSTARSTGTTTNAALIGLCISSTGATVNNVNGNTVDSLISGATSAAVNVIGLYATGSTSVSNVFSRNLIHSLGAPADAAAVIMGIQAAGGTSSYINNIIRLGINKDGSDHTTAATFSGIAASSTSGTNNFYHNSIYIGGAGVGTDANSSAAFRRTATSGTYSVLNNIFVNGRSNATTGGNHFSVFFTTNTTGVTLSNNLYNATGTGAMLGYNGAANQAAYAPGWIAGDVGSVSGNPQFVQATGAASGMNLHINTGVATLAESHGVVVAGVTNDYDGDSRSGYSGSAAGSAPDIGADEFAGIYISTACTGAPIAGNATTSVTPVCPTTSFTLGIDAINTATGVTYQWQSSPAGAGVWTNIGTVQLSPAYSTLQSAATDYRCVVKCTVTGDSTISVAVTVAQNPPTACYCANSYATTTQGYITNFTTTGGITNIANTSTNVSGGYNNFTAQSVSAVIGTSVNFTATTASTNYMSIFIDWNQDGDFDDAGEGVYSQNSSYASSFSGTIAVPPGATAGPTRMRVRISWSGTIGGACSSIGSGETEDYTFNAIPQTPCAGTPAPGNTNSTVNDLCVSGAATLSVDNNYNTYSGITRQWQSSPDGTNWTDIPGATAFTYAAANITATTSYRYRMICSAGPDTGYSVVKTIAVHALPVVTVTPSVAAFCSAGSATLLAGGANTYAWSPATGLSATSGASVDAAPTAITTYTVTGTDAFGCANTATATVGPIAAITPVATSQDICAPNTSVAVNVSPIATVGGTMEYVVTDVTGTVIANWQAGTAFTVTPTAPGMNTYYVFARNNSCPASVSDTATVSIFAGFAGTVVANNATCVNGDGSLVVTNPQGPGLDNILTWYANDFSSASLPAAQATLSGNASITGGRGVLTPSATGNKGGLTILNPLGVTTNALNVTFDMTADIPINTYGTGGADGIAYSFGDDATYGTGITNGAGSKLRVVFDAANNGTENNNHSGVYVTYGYSANTQMGDASAGVLAHSTFTDWKVTTDRPVSINITEDGKLTLTWNNTAIFTDVQLPPAYLSANKSTWKHLFTAFTGGDALRFAIDNLSIKYGTETFSYGKSPANSNVVPSTWQSSNSFSGLTGGDSLDIWIANPSNPATCNKKLGTYGISAPVMASVFEISDPSCVGTDDGYIALGVNASGTYDVTLTKNGGMPYTISGIASGTDGTNDFVLTSVPEGTYTNMKVTTAGGCVSNILNGPVTLTAPAATDIAPADASGILSQPGAGTQYYTDASCNLIAAVTSDSSLGDVTASVTVAAPVVSPSSEPFLGRHYEITPTTNGNDPAFVTLYFSEDDFTAYNASAQVGSAYPAILANGSNLRITAFHGLPSDGTTGPGGTYDASNSDLLQPSSITWNSTGNWWEVTVYSPNGFSGFFANTNTGTPLNVTLGDISAVNTGKQNRVNWNTKSEQSGDRFQVESSKDSKTFAPIGQVAAKGTAGDYAFVDEKPYTGTTYYRLLMINADGTQKYSKVVHANMGGGDFSFSVYPNPVNSEVTVKVSVVSGTGTVVVSDVTGRTISTKAVPASGVVSVSMNNLAGGVYLIRYQDDAHTETIKVNKN